MEQLAPAFRVPTSFSGLAGHPPFSCSALDETFELLDDEPLELLELLAFSGSVGSDPEPGIEDPPPLHAMRKTAVAEETPREETQRETIAMTHSS